MTLKSVTRTYGAGEARVRVLDGVDLAIEPGAFVALTGPEGGGKGTLLNLIGCLDLPDEGEVWIDGTLTAALGEAQRDAFRRRTVGMIFHAADLVPVLSARDNVALPLWLHTMSAVERDARAAQALAAVGLEPFAECLPARLTAAQCRRVALARAVVAGPRLLVADDPTANLDAPEACAFIELLWRLNATHGLTSVFSTCDERLLKKAHPVVELAAGRIATTPQSVPLGRVAHRAAFRHHKRKDSR